MATTDHKPPKGQADAPLWRRLGWLVALWGSSVVALLLVAWLVRLLMNAAGLKTP